MRVTEEAFFRIIEDTWNSTLGLRVERAAQPPTAMAESLNVCVKITGAWEGEVRIQCSPQMARSCAASIFQMDAEKVGPGEISDALSELVHIIGGNLKALLPPPVTLSLPTVPDPSERTRSTPPGQTVCRLALRCEGHPFLITLLGDLPAAARGQTQPVAGQRLSSENP